MHVGRGRFRRSASSKPTPHHSSNVRNGWKTDVRAQPALLPQLSMSRPNQNMKQATTKPPNLPSTVTQ